MMCAWQELLTVLPPKYRRDVDKQGREEAQEVRLRLGVPPEIRMGSGSRWLSGVVSQDDLNFVVNAASHYSPWAAASISKGFLTAPGGHRIGLCGEVVSRDGEVGGIRTVSSLCIRIARDFPGIAENIPPKGNLLILGPPGWGKTTLLRDIARRLSESQQVCVVDERGELFPGGFQRGRRMDVLSLCPKVSGLDMALRTMGPECIALDEITAEADAAALFQAANCGVRLLATAHAASREEFLTRSVYRILVQNRVFDSLLILHRDKSYHAERMCT